MSAVAINIIRHCHMMLKYGIRYTLAIVFATINDSSLLKW